MNNDQLDQLIKHSLVEAAGTQPSPTNLHERSVARGRTVRRRRMVALVITLGCVAGVGVGFANRPNGASEAGSGASPVADLVARVQGLHETTPSTGFWYVKTDDDLSICGGAVQQSFWRGPQGGALVSQDGSTFTEKPADDTAAIPTWAQLETLPTDPVALRARLQVLSGNPATTGPDLTLFEWVGDVLSDSPASPAVRARLIQVLADDPAAQVIGFVSDPVGRPALELDWKGLPYKAGAAAATLRLMLDPATGRTLAYRMLVGTADAGGVTVLAAGPTADNHTSPTGKASVVPAGVTALAVSPVTANGLSAADVAKGCPASTAQPTPAS